MVVSPHWPGAVHGPGHANRGTALPSPPCPACGVDLPAGPGLSTCGGRGTTATPCPPLDPRLPRAPASRRVGAGRVRVGRARRGGRRPRRGHAAARPANPRASSSPTTRCAPRRSPPARRWPSILDGDRWLACLPLSHLGGLSVVTRALSQRARPASCTSDFDAADVEAAAAEGVTLVTDGGDRAPRVDVGRVPADPARWRARAAGPPPTSSPRYGMTETGSGCVYDGEAAPRRPRSASDDGEISCAARCCHVRGTELPTTATATVRNPKDDRRVVRHRRPGELRRRSGRLSVHGRQGDLIITGGENVWPAAVEAVLAEHPGVAEVLGAVRADPEWGHRVVAVVVPTDPDTSRRRSDELRYAVKARLPSWAAPQELDLVDSLPRTVRARCAGAAAIRRRRSSRRPRSRRSGATCRRQASGRRGPAPAATSATPRPATR